MGQPNRGPMGRPGQGREGRGVKDVCGGRGGGEGRGLWCRESGCTCGRRVAAVGLGRPAEAPAAAVLWLPLPPVAPPRGGGTPAGRPAGHPASHGGRRPVGRRPLYPPHSRRMTARQERWVPPFGQVKVDSS